MELNGHYARDSDTLAVWTGEESVTGHSTECNPLFAVFLASEDGYHVVGFELIGGAGPYVRMEQGYDAGHDTLTIGETADDPARRTRNGDLVTHWRPDADSSPAFMDPIGVTIHGARAVFDRIKTI